jgi:hypothetical protein
MIGRQSGRGVACKQRGFGVDGRSRRPPTGKIAVGRLLAGDFAVGRGGQGTAT